MAHALAQRHSAPGERDASPGRAHAAAADRARSAQGEMSRAFALTSTWRAPVIHRACACGGGSNGNEEEEPIKRAPDASGLVSQPTDPAEIEADRIADQIMRMEDGTGDAIALAPPSPVARKCAACAAEEDTEEQVESLVSRATGGGGNPLDVSTRGRMESHFGRSFEDVRVHTSGAAAESASALHALAYTVGSDIVFGAGQYSPGGRAGERLLAHELTHVAQGASSMGAPIQRQEFIPIPETGPGFSPEFIPELPELPEIEIEPEITPEFEPELEPELEPEIGPEVGPEVGPEPAPQIEPFPEPFPPLLPQPQPFPQPQPQPQPQPDDEEDEPDETCGSASMPFTHVTWTPGPLGQGKTVKASPLTRCPGNTRGSKPSRSIYRPQFDCINAAGQRGTWVRAHVLHGKTDRRPLFNLHGPGNQMWNLIIGDQTLNGGMRAGAEDPAIDRVHLNNEVLWYESTVDSYVPGLDYFAQSITVNFGRYDTTTHTEGPRLGGGTFPLGTTPPNCPVTAAQSAAVPPGAAAAGPAAGATAAPHTSGTTLSFQSTLKICHRLLRSRTFHVPNGGLRVRIGAQWFDPSGRNIQSRADCPITEFHVSLEQSGTFWDSEISDTAIPVGHAQAIRWRYLDPGDYYLNIWTLNDDPNCCLTGEISVSTFDAPRPVRSRTPMIA